MIITTEEIPQSHSSSSSIIPLPQNPTWVLLVKNNYWFIEVFIFFLPIILIGKYNDLHFSGINFIFEIVSNITLIYTISFQTSPWFAAGRTICYHYRDILSILLKDPITEGNRSVVKIFFIIKGKEIDLFNMDRQTRSLPNAGIIGFL